MYLNIFALHTQNTWRKKISEASCPANEITRKYTMVQEEPLKSQGIGCSQLTPWAIAAVFISLLGACFIASSLITHYNLLRCRTGTQEIALPEDHVKLTRSREKSECKGSTWNCCPINWKDFQSHCYMPFNSKKIWDESEKFCDGLGAKLAFILTEAEQNFITQFLDKRFSYFLGLTNENPENQWRWVDNTPLNPSMAFWHEGEPSNNQGENCVVLVNEQNKWGWKDSSCNFARSSICKIYRATLI